jgi:hypothetical protein
MAGGALLLASAVQAQTLTSSGFAELRAVLYPQTAPNDRTRGTGEALVRFEPSLEAASWLRIAAGFDLRMDTHARVERGWTIDWSDRGTFRPPFSVRRLSAMFFRGGLTVELGKQFIRWGRADILNPTDRFAPRDYLSVVDSDFLGVTAVRATYESGGNTLDAVWVPRFTPSRIPLLTQRWTALPAPVELIPVVDGGTRYPAGSQAGLRWNHAGRGYEFSLSFYDGFNTLPAVESTVVPSPLHTVLTRVYPQMRMWGADAALPRRWFTLKGEVGYFTSATSGAGEYGIYVVQLERQVGEWLLVGGYAGDHVTAPVSLPAFEPELGLARAFLGRASVTLGPVSSAIFEAAVRRNGDGSWVKGQYTRTWGQHLRARFEGNWIRGAEGDFLGQFHRNSNVNLALRYSF